MYKEAAGINTGFVFNRMKRYYGKSILCITMITLFSLRGYAQLIGTGLIEDPARNTSVQKQTHSSLRTTSITSTIYSDTLQLPFFEDFSGIVVPMDSLKISTTDSLVKIYDNILNSYPDTTAIFIGFLSAPPINSLQDSLTKKIWHVKKIAPNVFTIDSSSALTTPLKKVQNTSVPGTYWRTLRNDSYVQTFPDSLKWEQGGNTYINNRFPINPVSYNVATFDGLQANGVPYNTINNFATGFTDNLTSLPINLKPYHVSDSIYLSFFWQQGGLGDVPDLDDYIDIDFKDSTGNWNTVQTIPGNQPYSNNFNIALVPITDSIYFFKDFQFRFQSYGRLSGPFDVWNIDYIYLNKNRTYADTLFDDKTIGNVPVSFLKRYTSMPYNQFFANKTGEAGPLVFTDNNLDQGVTNTQFFNAICTFTVEPSGLPVNTSSAMTHFPTSEKNRMFQDTCNINVTPLTLPTQPFYVNHTVDIALSDTSNILFANNNRFNTFTILWDYYAYDDGTPEWAVGANQIGTKMANKFTTNIMDTLTDIDIYFTRNKGPDMDGRTILLSVWDANYNLVTQQATEVHYGGFIRYKLNSPVIVGAGQDFYVGYQQNFVDLLSIGYDKNYDHSDAVYFNLTGPDWNVYNQQPGYSTGSMMIRPVFSKNQILITAVAKQEEENAVEIILYPVPTDAVLKIKGVVSLVSIYDLAGRKVISQSYNPYQEDKTIDSSSFPNGIYIIEIKAGNSTIIKKIIIQHSN
jgi:hypothetical protein